MKEVSGKMALQCRWVPADSLEFQGINQPFQIVPYNQKFVASIVEVGILEFVLVSCYLQ